MSGNLKPFFILGNPRSGTSMFRLMLNRHSKIVVPPECGYLLWYYDKYRSADFIDSAVIHAFVEDVCVAKKFETWGLSADEISNYLTRQCPLTYADACAQVHRLYAISKGKVPTLWGDKNNYYVAECQRLFELYPDAKFLFLIRDPRDVFTSYVDLSNLKTNSQYAPRLTVSAEEFSQEWATNLKRMDRLAALLQDDSFKYVRYEDVIRDSKETMEDVLAFLDLTLEDEVLAPRGETQFIEREPVDTLDWKKLTMKAPDRSRIGRFRDVISGPDLHVVEDVCHAGMSRFFYSS
jgi:hypothetical protein